MAFLADHWRLILSAVLGIGGVVLIVRELRRKSVTMVIDFVDRAK